MIEARWVTKKNNIDPEPPKNYVHREGVIQGGMLINGNVCFFPKKILPAHVFAKCCVF